MLKYCQQVVVLLLVMCLIGCQTTTTIKQPRPATAAQNIRVGDSVKILRKDGFQLLLRVTQITDKAIVGKTREKTVTVTYEEMETLYVRRHDPSKTTGLSVGIAVAVAAALWLLYAIVDGLTFGGSD